MKKIFLFSILLFQLTFVFGQNKDWGSWTPVSCYSRLSTSVLGNGYVPSIKEYSWQIKIKSTYSKKVTFNMTWIVGGERLSIGQVTLSPNESYGHTPRYFKSSSNNIVVEVSEVCFEGQDCYKYGYADCNGNQAKIPNNSSSTNSTNQTNTTNQQTTQQNDLSEYNRSKADLERQMAEKNAEITRQNEENARKQEELRQEQIRKENERKQKEREANLKVATTVVTGAVDLFNAIKEDKKNKGKYDENNHDAIFNGNLQEYIKSKLICPKSNLAEVKVNVRYYVMKNGNIDLVEPYVLTKFVNDEKTFEEEAIRVIKSTQNMWNVGKYDGQPINSLLEENIVFNCSIDNKLVNIYGQHNLTKALSINSLDQAEMIFREYLLNYKDAFEKNVFNYKNSKTENNFRILFFNGFLVKIAIDNNNNVKGYAEIELANDAHYSIKNNLIESLSKLNNRLFYKNENSYYIYSENNDFYERNLEMTNSPKSINLSDIEKNKNSNELINSIKETRLKNKKILSGKDKANQNKKITEILEKIGLKCQTKIDGLCYHFEVMSYMTLNQNKNGNNELMIKFQFENDFDYFLKFINTNQKEFFIDKNDLKVVITVN